MESDSQVVCSYNKSERGPTYLSVRSNLVLIAAYPEINRLIALHSLFIYLLARQVALFYCGPQKPFRAARFYRQTMKWFTEGNESGHLWFR
jgi:hypothetical protein